jgi:hypothetical protein
MGKTLVYLDCIDEYHASLPLVESRLSLGHRTTTLMRPRPTVIAYSYAGGVSLRILVSLSSSVETRWNRREPSRWMSSSTAARSTRDI